MLRSSGRIKFIGAIDNDAKFTQAPLGVYDIKLDTRGLSDRRSYLGSDS